MIEAIEAMEEAFASLSSGSSFVPQRYVENFGKESLTLLMKPVHVESMNRMAIKILTQKQLGAIRGIPALVGVVLIMDSLTGEIISLMDGSYLTALRTGAATGLATKYFANKNANTLAVFGCGVQGKAQLEAVCAIRNISKVWIFDQNALAAESFKNEMEIKVDAEIEIGEKLDSLYECDIICTATNSESPLFDLNHLKTGVHINAIGSFKPAMQEIDPSILEHAKIYVDQLGTCLAEAGDLIKPIKAGLISEKNITGEIGNYILGRIEGRTCGGEITVFKSVGVAVQDFMVANKIYEKSIAQNFGQEFNLFD